MLVAPSTFGAVVSESSTATDNYNPAGSIYNVTLLTSLTASDAFFAAYLWEPVDDSQIANWGDINNTQSAGWTNVDDSQTISWQNVDNTQTPNWGPVNDDQTPGWDPVIP